MVFQTFIDRKKATFRVVLSNGYTVVGTFTPVIHESDSHCMVTFSLVQLDQQWTNKIDGKKDSLQEKMNWLLASTEIQKILSASVRNEILSGFPGAKILQDNEESYKSN